MIGSDCAGIAFRLPEPEWNIARRKSNSQAHAVGPFVVVLEIAAVVLVHAQGQDSVGESDNLAAQHQTGRVASIAPNHVADGLGTVITSVAARAPAPQSRVGITSPNSGHRRG